MSRTKNPTTGKILEVFGPMVEFLKCLAQLSVSLGRPAAFRNAFMRNAPLALS
jgi:hypothetical protein